MDQAEKLRQLVNKSQTQEKQEEPLVQQALEPQMQNVARVITVTSGKGGVGKSSLSVNLALQLQKLGKRVIILDADFGLANVEIMLGIRPQYSLADLMFHEKNLRDIITRGPNDIGFISGGSGIKELSNLTKEQILYLTQKLEELDDMADVIIIDTAAGISDGVLEFLTVSTEILLVVTPEPTSITDAYALLKTLNQKAEFSTERTVIKMVANKVYALNEGRNLFEKMNAVIRKFLNIELEFIGAIPNDEAQPRAIMQQKPISLSNPNAPAAKAFAELARRIYDGELPTENKQEQMGISDLFSSLIKLRFRGKKK